MAAVELPDELILEILSMLPAKSLLRCRSVCKSWLNLISSTGFKLMHLRNFNQRNPRYFAHSLDYYENDELYDVHLDDEAFTLDDGTQIEFPFDVCRVNNCYWIIGCCNGVICLSDENNVEGDAFSLDAIILWNPSIRRKLTLPLPMFNSVGFNEPIVVLGFGYDIISDDYKVVSLTYDASSSGTRPHVEVYTAKTGIWREVMFPDNLRCSYFDENWSQIFCNGCVHWIASDPTPGVSHYSIITFDITTELFGEIQFPEFLGEKLIHWTVCVVGESLAVIHSSGLNFGSGSRYMVWAMKEYKNPASWTMLYDMHYPEVDLGKPLRLGNNSDMIVELENGDIIMFNHDKGCYVYVFRDGEEEEEDFYPRTYLNRYEESLALLDVGDRVPNKEAMKDLMMIKKQGMGLCTFVFAWWMNLFAWWMNLHAGIYYEVVLCLLLFHVFLNTTAC